MRYGHCPGNNRNWNLSTVLGRRSSRAWIELALHNEGSVTVYWITVSLLIVVLPALLVLGTGCASLTSFEDVKAAVGSENFVKIDNRRVHVVRSGSGQPAVLLLHGFAASAYTFRKIVPLLATDRRVLAVDWYGFGWTERPSDLAAYSLDSQLAMIHGVLEKEGAERIHIVGHSFGAVLADYYARKYPDSVVSLTFVSPPTDFESMPRLLRSRLGRTLFYPVLRLFLSRRGRFADMQRRGYFEPDALIPEDLEAYRQRLLVKGLWYTLHGIAAWGDSGAARPEYGARDVPTLILAGRHDSIVPLETVQRMVADMPGVTFAILEKSGHNAPEEEPETVVEKLNGFFWGQQHAGD